MLGLARYPAHQCTSEVYTVGVCGLHIAPRHQGDEAANTIEIDNVCTATVRAAATDVRAAAYRVAAAISNTRPANAAARGPVGIHAGAAWKPAGLPSVRYADVSTDDGTALVREPFFQRPAAIFAATASNGTWTCTTGNACPTGFAATTGRPAGETYETYAVHAETKL